MSMEMEPLVQKMILDAQQFISQANEVANAYRKLNDAADITGIRSAVQDMNEQYRALTKLTEGMERLARARDELNQKTKGGPAGAAGVFGPQGMDMARALQQQNQIDAYLAEKARVQEDQAAARSAKRINSVFTPEQMMYGGTAANDPRASARMVAGMSSFGREETTSISASNRMIAGMSTAGILGGRTTDIVKADEDFAKNLRAVRTAQGIADAAKERGASATQMDALFGPMVTAAKPPRVPVLKPAGDSKFGAALSRLGSAYFGYREFTRGMEEMVRGFSQVVQGFVHGMEEEARTAVQGFKEVMGGLVNGMTTIIAGMMSGNLGQASGGLLRGFGQMAGGTASGVGGFIGGTVSSMIQMIGTSIQGLSKMISGGIQMAGGLAVLALAATGVGAPAAAVILIGTQIFSKITDMVGDLIGGVLGAVGRVIGTVVSGLASTLGTVLQAAFGVGGDLMSYMINTGMKRQSAGPGGALFNALQAAKIVNPDVALDVAARQGGMGRNNIMGTVVGQWERLSEIVDETVGRMGVAFMKSAQFVQILQSIGNWIQNNADALTKVMGRVGEFAGAGINQLGRVALVGMNNVADAVGGGGLGNGDANEIMRGVLDATIDGLESMANAAAEVAAFLGRLLDPIAAMMGAMKMFVGGLETTLSALGGMLAGLGIRLPGGGAALSIPYRFANAQGWMMMGEGAHNAQDAMLNAPNAVRNRFAGFRADLANVGNIFQGGQGAGADINRMDRLSPPAQALLTHLVGMVGVPGASGTGITPAEAFRNQMDVIKEASQFKGGAMSPRMRMFGMYEAYQKMVGSLGGRENYAEHLAPAAMFGTSEAADVIGKAQLQAVTVEEEMNRNIGIMTEMSGRLEERMTEVRDWLQRNAIVVKEVGAQ